MKTTPHSFSLTGATPGDLLVFSDLDGTLLDHDTYGFAAARPALARLKRLGVPLILSSSKTLAEIRLIQRDLGTPYPFIAENGSVVAVPRDCFPENCLEAEGFTPDGEVSTFCPGGSRTEVLHILHRLREEQGVPFTGFADMDDQELSALTGLSLSRAALARDRISTEPVVWQGTGPQWADFARALGHHGLAWVQGGRFISISRPFDKRDGAALIARLYRKNRHRPPVTIGLGDSPNDQALLCAMDLAVVIRSHRSEAMEIKGPAQVVRTRARGPAGWQEAMDRIFEGPEPLIKTT